MRKYLMLIIVICLCLMLLSFLAGIGVSAVFFQHEVKVTMPDTTFEEDLHRYLTGESKEEMIQKLDKIKREIAEEEGYESYEELLKAEVERDYKQRK